MACAVKQRALGAKHGIFVHFARVPTDDAIHAGCAAIARGELWRAGAEQ
jgi:hypothetical protein